MTDKKNDYSALKFDAHGLIPAIVQDKDDGEVLMMAWMNEEAVRMTMSTGFAHYWSRSRQKLWKKGESSGHTQAVAEVLYDCDADCLLVKVAQKEAACHTGHRSCFFSVLAPGGAKGGGKGKLVFDPAKVYEGKETREALDRLYGTVVERMRNPKPDSYTNQLLDGGHELRGKKLVEEAFELSFAARDGKRDQVVRECADLLYHAWVVLGAAGVKPDEVYAELAKRTGKGGLQEKADRKK
jgi:phosphoribosyl-ATP pyrophosphohydrolase/phosphoribosyl-AMP cyclohydrolase